VKLSTIISLVALVFTAGILAAVRVFTPADAGFAAQAVSLAIVAGGAALAVWAATTRLIDKELHRLNRHVESLGAGDAMASGYKPPAWCAPLAENVGRGLGQLRRKVEEQNSRRRELEIQARVAEAERQQVEAILHSISDAVLVTDAFNEVTLANDAAANALRFVLDGSRHQPVDRIVQDPALVKMIKDTREASSAHNRRHMEHRVGQNGHGLIYDVSLSCVSNAQQEVSGVVTILRDVTKEREISEMKSDFVSGVSHELRTPLSSIKAYIEMLVDGEAADEQTRQEFYNIIQSETNRLSRLIDNILNISRIESGVVKVQREQVSLPKLISEAMDVMRPQARAKQITLVEQPTPLYYTIQADKDMVYQALLNLIGNAIKYTPAGGKVTVDTTVDETARTAAVHVADNGVGIPPEAVPHVFDKFYRVPDHKKMAKGTGLGLNLVKHIVETVHQGKVAVISEVGKGSRFTMTLPTDRP
jgi:two-component system phosphate regulon sensor histidine kinase PhoR